jgi:IS605 OrfB family transposase
MSDKQIIILTKKFYLKATEEQSIILGSMCKSSAKLWNIANYEKRNYKELGFEKYPNWYDQKKRLKNNFWYKNLPSQTAQEVLNILEKSWKSFFKLKETGGTHNPRPPRFKKKGSKYNIKYLNNGFKIEGDIIRFSIPEQQREYLKSTYGIESKYLYVKIKRFSQLNLKVKEIEFKPLKNGDYEIFIAHEVKISKFKKDNGRYLSIDLGVANLMTCYDNFNKRSFIISGRQWLSINRYFDKKIGYYQNIADRQQTSKGIKHPRKTKKVKKLYAKRRKQLNHLIHSATKSIVDYCIENNISKVIIGDLKNVRKNANLGKTNNQKFHKLPFKQIVDKLTYKLKLENIEVIKIKESYTSQCSPLSKDVSKRYAKKSNRKHRGLYKDGIEIFNADSVGAFNIMRLFIKKSKKNIKLTPKGLSNPYVYKFNMENTFKVAV